MAKSISPRYVQSSSGMRQPYYNIKLFQTELSWQLKYYPEKKGGIIFIPTPKGYHRLFFIIGHEKYKFNNKLLTTTWPVLRNNKKIYLPYNILYPLCKKIYQNHCTWKRDKLIVHKKYKPASTLDLEKKTPDKKNNNDKPKITTGRKYQYNIQNIIIDAGHGGRDPGAIYGRSKNQIQEKKIVLQVALKLKQQLRAKAPHLNIYLTRDKDTYLTLEKRTQMANRIQRRKGGSLFVSIHTNSSISSRTRGVEVYYLNPNASNEERRFISSQEKKWYPDNSQKNITAAEFFLFNAQLQKESYQLAKALIKSFRKTLTSRSSLRGIKRADFVVLRGSLMPAVLVELGFLTHSRERRLLQQKNYQTRLAKAISQGILDFIRE